MNTTKISKFMSLVLRHKPEAANLKLDQEGWADINELIKAINRRGHHIGYKELEKIVETNDKKRFIISECGCKIRANQGHSININLNLNPIEPPEILYHGTATRFLTSIFTTGLTKQSRQHVHLSKDRLTATKVGSRHGKPIILEIASAEMYRKGYTFYLSENGVWLTDSVPIEYINKADHD